MQLLSIADREALLSDILNQAIAAIGRYRIEAEQPTAANGDCPWCIDYLSPGYEILYGYAPEELIANPNLWRSRVHPEDWQACILPNLMLIYQVQGTESQTIAAEYRVYHKDGSLRWISENLTIRRDETANCWTITCLAVDITDRKRTEILLEVQNRILAQIAKGEPLPLILDSLMVAIEAQLNGALCSILLLDQEGKLRHGSAPHLPETYIQAIDGILPGEGVGSCGTAVFRRERVIVPDIASDFLWQDYKSLALQHRLRACWSMPILAQEGRVLGTFAVYYREARSPQSAELEVITLAANIAEVAIARSQFETALRDSEAKSRAIIATIPDLMFRASRDGKYLEYFTYQRSFDILPANVNPTGQRIADFVPPEMVPRKMVAIQQALDTQTLQVYEQHIQVGDLLRYEEVRVAPSGTDEVLFIIRDISERKQAEVERKQMQALLQHSEKEFRALVENSPDIIERFDPQMRHLYVSPSMEKLSGLSAQAFIGKTCCDLGLDTAMVNLWETAMQTVLATGQKQSVEFSFQMADGIHHYEALLVPEFADDGTIESILCISRDVSDRKQAEQKLRNLVEQLEDLNNELEAKVAARTVELRDSEERFRSMYEQSPLGISITDLEGRLVRINPSLSQITGYSEAELLGKHYLDLVHPDDRPKAAQLFQQILQGYPQQSVSEKRYLTKTGDEVWVSVTRATIRDRQGQPTYVIGMVQDIRDRKRLEAERHQAQLDLQAQKEFLQRVIDSVPSCIFVKDTEGLIQVINQATAELYGIATEAAMGKQIAEFDSHLSPAQRDIFNLEDQTVLQTGQPLVKQDYVVAHNQQIRCYQTTLKPFSNRQGEIQGLIGNSVDISDRKQAEEKLREANQTLAIANNELARANRLKDEFLANMSHELRTPLNAVLGLSQVLREEAFGGLNDKQRQFVDNILSSGNHLLSLINDILDLAKIESGKFDLERSPTSIHTLCESSLNFVRQQAQQKHISLEAQLPPEAQLIELDERRMRQVLINLLNNGVKFTADGGRVTLRVRLSSHWVLFEVEDTGIGIASSDHDKLFQPFVQIDSSLSRRYEGTGLGLVLVKQIVELHGGQVSVTSELEKGSCFTVRIPSHPLPQIQPLPSLSPSPPLPLPPSPSSTHPLILLAEDNQDTQQLLQDYLQLNDFRVILAQNGIEALHMAQTYLPQVILMDIQMPDMDGLKAIQRLKTNPETATIPVIAVTASATRSDRERCIAAGASDYLSKPMQLHQLVTKLKDWLSVRLDVSTDRL